MFSSTHCSQGSHLQKNQTNKKTPSQASRCCAVTVTVPGAAKKDESLISAIFSHILNTKERKSQEYTSYIISVLFIQLYNFLKPVFIFVLFCFLVIFQ